MNDPHNHWQDHGSTAGPVVFGCKCPGCSQSNTGREDYDSGVGNSNLTFGGVDAMTDKLNRWDASWGSGTGFGNSGGLISYSFYEGYQNGYRPVSDDGRDVMDEAFRIISEVADISFFNTYSGGDIEISAYNGGGLGGVGGWSGTYQNPQYTRITDGFVDVSGVNIGLYLHEIGHSIGLAHPGEYDGNGSNYSADAAYWDDTTQYTLMSYWEPSETGANYRDFTQDTLMLYDIAALQRIYGANDSTRTGDTVYGFNSTPFKYGRVIDDVWRLESASDDIIGSVWDAGGTDKLDLSGYSSDSDIDLREGAFSSFGDLINNFSIAYGAVIENADGGSGRDTIHGNAVANTVRGFGGADRVYSLGGNDTVYGGDGNDTLKGGNGNDLLRGNKDDDRLEGQSGNDDLNGGDGEDLLLGGAGRDIGRGGAGDDYVYGGDDDDTLYGEAGNDVLVGGDGADTMRGGADDDRLKGRDGDDELYGDGGSDILLGHEGIDNLRGGTGADFLYGGRDDDVVNGGSGNDVVKGNRGNDALLGETGDDRLEGGGGNDQLNGGDGRDYVVGENGADVLYGGTGDDVLIGGAFGGNGDGARDTFVYALAPGIGGYDRIRDFEDGTDRIAISDMDISSYAELAPLLSDVAAGAKINFGNGSVLLVENVQAAQLTEADFDFI